MQSNPDGTGWLEDQLRLIPESVDERLRLRDDLDAALGHVREVRDRYWEHDRPVHGG